MTEINPRTWWEQISEYIHLTYNRNLDETMDQGTDQMDPHTVSHKGRCYLGTRSQGQTRNHERLIGQRAERGRLIRTFEIIQKDIQTRKKRVP